MLSPTMLLLSCFLLPMLFAQVKKPNICDFIYCENMGSCGITNRTTFGFHCQCPFGFTGLLCETRMNVTTCGTNPCKNGGVCSITNTQAIKCTCLASYTGVYCETKMK